MFNWACIIIIVVVIEYMYSNVYSYTDTEVYYEYKVNVFEKEEDITKVFQVHWFLNRNCGYFWWNLLMFSNNIGKIERDVIIFCIPWFIEYSLVLYLNFHFVIVKAHLIILMHKIHLKFYVHQLCIIFLLLANLLHKSLCKYLTEHARYVQYVHVQYKLW